MDSASKPRYRPAKHMTEEIQSHCHIFLDEQLYINALTLLNDLVTSGASHPKCLETPAFAPLPFHTELASTLLIHPRHTNQAPPHESLALASRSITFLRNVLRILGPLNGNLDEAFSLSPVTGSRTSRLRRCAVDTDEGSNSPDSEGKPENMRGVIANTGRLRRSAKDFWHVLGWALNCSVKYPTRWKYWKVWLDFMLDVLDADWKERQIQDENGPNYPKEMPFSANSLLVKYVADAENKSAGLKRIVRSVFADGSPGSLRDYPEVFHNETLELKVQNGQKRKREETSVATFGDYDEDKEGDSEYLEQTTTHIQDSDDEDATSWLGGPESIVLRQRVLALLSAVAASLPSCIAGLDDLYNIICTCVKPLPLPAFSLILSTSSSSRLPDLVFVSLAQMLLIQRFLPQNAPLPNREHDNVSQSDLQRSFLPFAANTSSIADNAKVSILVETLFRLFINRCFYEYTPELSSAIDAGIVAREKKIRFEKKKGSRNREESDDMDMVWLRASGQRLRSLLALVKQRPYVEHG